MKSQTVLLTVFLFAGALHLEKVRASCFDSAPASNLPEWEHGRDTRELKSAGDPPGLAAVMSDYTFSCEGIVTQWRVRWQIRGLRSLNKDCEVFFDFHVLRPSSIRGYCGVMSVGKNRMTVQHNQLSTPAGNRSIQETVFNVSEVDRLRVKSSDFVGLSVTFNQSTSCLGHTAEVSIIEPINTTNLSRIHYRRQEFASDTIADSEFNRLGCNGVSKDSEDRQDTNGSSYLGAPLVNAVVGPDSQEEEQQESDDSGDSGTMVSISVAVAVGGLLIIAGVTAIVCVWQHSRQKKKGVECPTNENKAYNKATIPPQPLPVHGTDVDLKIPLKPPQYAIKQNIAYGIHTTPETTTSSASASADRYLPQQTVPESIGRYDGNCYIVDESVYEVPSSIIEATHDDW